MKSNHKDYNFNESKKRIDEILNSNDINYEEFNYIPSRDKLTFTNGFYADCSALFIDIRNSSQLPQNHSNPILAKLYKIFISESIAIMNANKKCSEINIQGDCVWGVFNTPHKSDIDSVLDTTARLSSLIDTINIKLNNKNISPINVGIGVAYGKALKIKAGYDGSTINDVVYIGDVVNEASKLSCYGSSTFLDYRVMISDIFYNNLKDEYRSFFSYNSRRECYHSDIFDKYMNTWVQQNKV